ncbi:hypothetical protein C8R43DRAFT_966654 [Mycena crocata]|nr:hypothetical protein C8R43DRAFT_966654 [Mycena crocata]
MLAYFFISLLVSLTLRAAAQSSSQGAASTSDVGAGSDANTNSTGTPTNSAALPNLSGVSSCVTNCLAIAASAAGCTSEVAVDCFCVNPQPYTTSLLTCLGPCPEQVSSAEALVQQFCAAAAQPTSLSFGSFTPSSASTSASNSHSASGSTSVNLTSVPPSSTANTSPSTTPNAGAKIVLGLGSLGTAVVVGVVSGILGAQVVA